MQEIMYNFFGNANPRHINNIECIVQCQIKFNNGNKFIRTYKLST